MAGRSKKENNNLEKIKREMTAKKQRAKKTKSIDNTLNNSNQSESEMHPADTENSQHNTAQGIGYNSARDSKEGNVLNSIHEGSQDSEQNREHSSDEEIITEQQLDRSDEVADEISKIQMAIFRIGEEEYAIETSNVKEIIRIPPMNNVPNSPFYIAGMCSIRGELLPVIDSRKLFGMADVEFDEGSRIVVTDISGSKVGLIADKVSEVISIEESVIKEPPASVSGMDGGIVKGILLLNNGKRVIMVLDAVKIVKAGSIGECHKMQTIHDSNHQELNNTKLQEEQVILFNIGAEEYAFDINTVKEIIRITDIMKVPNTADYIEGVISIRNQLMAVINLGTLLGKSQNNISEQSRIIIIDNGLSPFGVIVDRVSQVMRVQRNDFKGRRLTAAISDMEYARGFLELNRGKRLAMLLDPLKLVVFEDMDKILTQSSKSNNYITADKGEAEYNIEHVVIFKLDKEEYAINIHSIKEINRVSDIVYFPGAPAYIEGMVNLRGEVIPVLNIKTMFNGSITMTDYSKFLVVEYENKKIGILIDSVSEVLRIPKSYIEAASDMLNRKENDKNNGIENNNSNDNDNDRYIDAIAKLNEGKRIVQILNLSAVLSFM